MGIVTSGGKHLRQVEKSLISQALVNKQTELVDNSLLNGKPMKLIPNISSNTIELSLLKD